MSNYSSEDRCVGCNAHISEYHERGCVYDPDFEPVTYCAKCEDTIVKEGEGCAKCSNELCGACCELVI